MAAREREYFYELVRLGRAKREEDVALSLKRLQAIKGVQFRTVADDKIAFFEKWYHMPVWSLLSIYPFNGKNYRHLGSLLVPQLSAQEARNSIQLLERLGLVERDKDGYFKTLDTFISTPDKWSSVAIKKYQESTIELSLNALETLPKNQRDVTTVTFTCSMKHLDTLRERLQSIRQEMLMLSQDDPNEDCVMQLNLQLFPAAIVKKEEDL